jgi:alkanesulfonate monooxygenase SsuD/methylene tetrahydromethanopterin reductase-like flavin-dependent oxidoreductase (luciferase family)
MSDPALRRAVRQGDGWYGFALDPDATAKCIAGIRRAEADGLRPEGRGPLEITVTPAGVLDRDALRRFEDVGVDRLVPLALGATVDDMRSFVEKTAEVLAGAG